MEVIILFTVLSTLLLKINDPLARFWLLTCVLLGRDAAVRSGVDRIERFEKADQFCFALQ